MGSPDVLGEQWRAETDTGGHVTVNAVQVSVFRGARVERVLVVAHAQLLHLHLLCVGYLGGNGGWGGREREREIEKSEPKTKQNKKYGSTET